MEERPRRTVLFSWYVTLQMAMLFVPSGQGPAPGRLYP